MWVQNSVHTTVPGTIYVSPVNVSADSNFLVLAPDISADDVQSYGVFLLQIYNFDVGGEDMNFFSLNCYTRCEAVVKPAPLLGSLNVKLAFYPGLKSKPRTIELWTET